MFAINWFISIYARCIYIYTNLFAINWFISIYDDVFCSSWSKFEACLARRSEPGQCDGVDIGTAVEDIRDALKADYEPRCSTGNCNYARSEECRAVVKQNITSAWQWEADHWSNEGCTPARWIQRPMQPHARLPAGTPPANTEPSSEQQEGPDDHDDCLIWNPCTCQCLVPSCTDLSPEDKKKHKMMMFQGTRNDDTCQSWFGWGGVCK